MRHFGLYGGTVRTIGLDSSLLRSVVSFWFFGSSTRMSGHFWPIWKVPKLVLDSATLEGCKAELFWCKAHCRVRPKIIAARNRPTQFLGPPDWPESVTKKWTTSRSIQPVLLSSWLTCDSDHRTLITMGCTFALQANSLLEHSCKRRLLLVKCNRADSRQLELKLIYLLTTESHYCQQAF